MRGASAAAKTYPQDIQGHPNRLKEEANDTPDVVINMYIIAGITALVLFDSGATRSFISSTFV